MVLGYTQLASIPITLSRMRLDSKLFSSEASQLGLPWVGSLLTHPSTLIVFSLHHFCLSPRCLYTNPDGESRHFCYLKILWGGTFVGWEEKRQKIQLKASLIIQVGLVTGWLGNGVAPDLHIQLAIIT